MVNIVWMEPCYLIYHPSRQQTIIGNLTVYHDDFRGNEDPYLWNQQFLHTYCHITQLSNQIGQLNLWVSGDTYPNFTALFCDCVFLISEKHYWEDANRITPNDPIVDNNQTYEHHYKWVNPPYYQHLFEKRKRYTLKAHPEKSFQPQNSNKDLINILPFLNNSGVSTPKLIRGMTSNKGSRPYRLPNGLGKKLYSYINSMAQIKLFGQQLANLHP